MAPKFNFGSPSVVATRVGPDGSLELRQDYLRDGRGLELLQAERVVEYVGRVWRRPVMLHTVDFGGVVRILPAEKPSSAKRRAHARRQIRALAPRLK